MHFELHTPESAPAGSRQRLAKIAKKYGFVPNLAAVFAESPAVLDALSGLMITYDNPQMTLTTLERQVVLLTASLRNSCKYCTAGHSMLANMNGLERADIENLQQGRPLADERLERLRKFVELVVENRGLVGDSEIESFIAAGFSKAQILEVLSGVALKTLTNYAYHIAQPQVNKEFADFLPDWSEAT